nr:PREDICTED: uncharacterized protein LOC109625363 [Paralichthys olivaceus]
MKMMATDAEEIRTHTSPRPVPDSSLSTVPIKIRRRQQESQWRLRFIYLQCYFLTIATILGTGILGLPVTIAHAGLVPFLVSFLVGFFVQGLLIYLFVELLQKCQVVQLESIKILWFRRAVLGGLTTCTILNILWCWAVLEIVPQTSLPEMRTAVETSTHLDSSSPPGQRASAPPLLYSNISLEESEKAGEIATIPLTRIINERYRAYSWVAELIQVFIAISVSVSFLVMGSAMKHTIDGLVSSMWSRRLEWLSKAWERNLPNKQHICSARSVVKGFMSLLAFVAIFIVSVCDPRGFVVMLDKVVSFSLNTEVGLFVFIMLRESREDRFQHLAVPLPVGNCVFSLTWLLPTYFLFAVTYDVLQTLADVAHYLHFYSHGQEAHYQNVSGSVTAVNVSVLL